MTFPGELCVLLLALSLRLASCFIAIIINSENSEWSRLASDNDSDPGLTRKSRTFCPTILPEQKGLRQKSEKGLRQKSMHLSFLYWRPDRDGYKHMPCGTIRVTKNLHFHATDLVWAIHGSDNRSYARTILKRLIDPNTF